MKKYQLTDDDLSKFEIEDNEDIENNSPQKPTIAERIFVGIMMIILANFILFTIDGLFLNNHIFKTLYYPKCDCTYSLPTDVKIVYNGKAYAIQKTSGTHGKQYMWENRGKNVWMYPEIANGDLFLDSCLAKREFKYLSEKQNKMRDFK